MRSYARLVVGALVLLLSLTAFAGPSWEKETIITPNNNIVRFWRWWDAYRNQFTLYKELAGMRFYMTVFGATYPEFEYYMQWDTITPTVDGGNPFPDETQVGYIGGINLTEQTLVNGNGGIQIQMYMSDHFGLRWGTPASVAFSFMPSIYNNRGSMPNVDVEVNNADVTQLKVVYPRPPIDTNPQSQTYGQYLPSQNQKYGIVTCIVNNNNGNSPQTQKFGGGLGGIQVGGGFIGSGTVTVNSQVEARNGIGIIICEPRRIRKLKQLDKQFGGISSYRIGGSAGGRIFTRKNIRILKLGNGLGVAANSTLVAGLGAMTPAIAAGYYQDRQVNASLGPYWCSLYRVILPRGGEGGIVAAGSLPSTTATGYDFKGNIGKIKLNSRGGGYTDLTTNCTFISSIQPVVKVKDLTKVIDSNVITVNGTFPIDATYPRLKQ